MRREGAEKDPLALLTLVEMLPMLPNLCIFMEDDGAGEWNVSFTAELDGISLLIVVS